MLLEPNLVILWEAYLQRLELVLSDSSGNRTSGDRTSGGPPVKHNELRTLVFPIFFVLFIFLQ